MPEPTAVETDQFLDDQFAPLDMRGEGAFADQLEQLAAENPEFAPLPEPGEEPATPPAEPAAAAPTEPVEPQPEILQLEDGSTVTIERTAKKGWKATLQDADGGNSEPFYGATQMELLQRVAIGKLNATKQIRKLNRQVKLGTARTRPAEAPTPAPVPQLRELTADEKFALKQEMANDPDLANQKWFQQKTGMTLQELVTLAKEGATQGRAANVSLITEAIARDFVAQTPEYYRDDKGANVVALVSWLSKNRLNRAISPAETDDAVNALYEKGFWTVQDLTEAYEDLNEAGLLVQEPAESPEDEPAVAPAAPAAVPAATPPTNERIVRSVRRPRAGLGLRPSETTSRTEPEAEKPPSVDELDNLSDKAISELFSGTRRLKSQTRR